MSRDPFVKKLEELHSGYSLVGKKEIEKVGKSTSYTQEAKEVLNYLELYPKQICEIMDKIEQGTPLHNRAYIPIKHRAVLKKEIYGYATTFLEQYWKNLTDIRNELEDALIEHSVHEDTLLQNDLELRLIERINFCASHMKKMMLHALILSTNVLRIPHTADNLENDYFLSYGQLLHHEKDKSGSAASWDIYGHITSGINTALGMIWPLVLTIPLVYKKQYDHFPTGQELISVFQDAVPLLARIAHSHLDVFSIIHDILIQRESLNSISHVVPFRAECFSFLEKENGKKQLIFTLETLNQMCKPSYEYSNNPRIGCPAMFAKGEQGKSVFYELMDWTIALLKKEIVPLLSKDS